MLITAGPTHEPIDAVRYIGNRSSGRMGIAIALAAAERGWDVTLLLGPVPSPPPQHQAVRVFRFRTCADLQRALREAMPAADVLVMAAAVADFRPRPNPGMAGGKFRRTEGPLTLELESTPDLLAEVGRSRRPNQFLVGFALEPRDEMIASARAKLERKRVDVVVANPLETMDSPEVEGVLVSRHGETRPTPPRQSKENFARWLLDQVAKAADVLQGR
jgi:phosphopantothenoylcysteine decarboxylase/phosphopantothenate--cysteine ligase